MPLPEPKASQARLAGRLLRKATTRIWPRSLGDIEAGIPLGWNNTQHLLVGPRQKTITWQAPFFRPDRKQDHRTTWVFFEVNTS